MITEVSEPQSASVTEEIDFARLTGLQPDIVNDASLGIDDFSEDLYPEQHRIKATVICNPFVVGYQIQTFI